MFCSEQYYRLASQCLLLLIQFLFSNEYLSTFLSDPNVFTGGVAYIVGSNFCLRAMNRLSVTLDCPISTSPVPIPTPYRSWSKDGVQIFNVTLGAAVTVSMNFTMDPRNEIFATGVINPNVLTVTNGGSLVFNTDIFNSTDPRFSALPIAELQEEVLDAITGTYTCTSGNSFGRDQATSRIRECGKLMEQLEG